MAKTRPGVERITKQTLTAIAVDTEAAIHYHLTECIACKRAGNKVRDRCTVWWNLAKVRHQTRRKLRQFSAPDTAGMDTLPGLE